MEEEAMESKEVLASDVSNSHSGHKVDQAVESNGQDESGISEDMNMSSNISISGWSCNNHTSVSDCNNHASPVCMSGSEGVSTENSFSYGSMKKDDSGIYSEKSPNVTSPKEASDGEFSESLSESLEDNQCTINFKQENIAEITEIDLPAKDITIASVLNCKVLSGENDSEPAIQDNKYSESDNDKNVSKCCDPIFEQQDEEMLSSETKEEIVCDDADSDKKEADMEEASKNISDSDDGSQKEDETWTDFMKNVIKVSSSNRKLVDYDDTDSEKEQAETAVTAKGRRRYRKRRPDSDDTEGSGESEAHDNDDDDANNDDETTPVLLRHSPLQDSPQGLDSLDHDSFSDSSKHEADTKESSESESEETPMDLSEFGPPKHKWKALFDIRHREYGYSTSTPSDHFMKKVQGSLQMVQRFELQFKMDHHEGCVNALHFNKTGTLLASGSDDLNIVVWNWIRNRPALVYDSGHRSNVFQSKFMPFSGDCHIVSCARDGQVRLAYLSTTGVCKSTKKIAQHKGAAHKLALEMDSPHIFLSCGEDAVTYEIDLREDKPHKLVTSKENDKKVAMYSIHSNPVNSNEFCLGGRDHFIRVYDKRKISEDVDGGLLKKFVPDHIASTEKENMKANVTCACYNYNGTEILGTYNDEDIYLFSNEHSDSANYIHRYRGHRNNQTVKGVNFYGPKSEFVVSGSDCGHIFLWDKDTENIVQRMEGDDGGVINVLEPHPYAPVLATSGLDSDVKVWAPTAEHPTELKGLKKLTKRNQKEREEERSSDGAMIEGSMLWFIMNQLRRGRRRRERQARAARGDADDDDSDTVSDEDLTASEDSDSEGSQVDRIQCNPS